MKPSFELLIDTTIDPSGSLSVGAIHALEVIYEKHQQTRLWQLIQAHLSEEESATQNNTVEWISQLRKNRRMRDGVKIELKSPSILNLLTFVSRCLVYLAVFSLIGYSSIDFNSFSFDDLCHFYLDVSFRHPDLVYGAFELMGLDEAFETEDEPQEQAQQLRSTVDELMEEDHSVADSNVLTLDGRDESIYHGSLDGSADTFEDSTTIEGHQLLNQLGTPPPPHKSQLPAKTMPASFTFSSSNNVTPQPIRTAPTSQLQTPPHPNSIRRGLDPSQIDSFQFDHHTRETNSHSMRPPKTGHGRPTRTDPSPIEQEQQQQRNKYSTHQTNETRRRQYDEETELSSSGTQLDESANQSSMDGDEQTEDDVSGASSNQADTPLSSFNSASLPRPSSSTTPLTRPPLGSKHMLGPPPTAASIRPKTSKLSLEPSDSIGPASLLNLNLPAPVAHFSGGKPPLGLPATHKPKLPSLNTPLPPKSSLSARSSLPLSGTNKFDLRPKSRHKSADAPPIISIPSVTDDKYQPFEQHQLIPSDHQPPLSPTSNRQVRLDVESAHADILTLHTPTSGRSGINSPSSSHAAGMSSSSFDSGVDHSTSKRRLFDEPDAESSIDQQSSGVVSPSADAAERDLVRQSFQDRSTRRQRSDPIDETQPMSNDTNGIKPTDLSPQSRDTNQSNSRSSRPTIHPRTNGYDSSIHAHPTTIQTNTASFDTTLTNDMTRPSSGSGPLSPSSLVLPPSYRPGQLCEMCDDVVSEVYCANCRMYLCRVGNCDAQVHNTPKSKPHTRVEIPTVNNRSQTTTETHSSQETKDDAHSNHPSTHPSTPPPSHLSNSLVSSADRLTSAGVTHAHRPSTPLSARGPQPFQNLPHHIRPTKFALKFHPPSIALAYQLIDCTNTILDERVHDMPIRLQRADLDHLASNPPSASSNATVSLLSPSRLNSLIRHLYRDHRHYLGVLDGVQLVSLNQVTKLLYKLLHHLATTNTNTRPNR